jgi:hypothetical protein
VVGRYIYIEREKWHGRESGKGVREIDREVGGRGREKGRREGERERERGGWEREVWAREREE